MESMTYRILKEGLNGKSILFKTSKESPKDFIKNYDRDHYSSIYYYNEDHLSQFKKTGSIGGIKDVTTNILAFDFDCKEDLNKARKDALTLIERLRKVFKMTDNQLEIYFSGQKGFTLTLKMDKFLPPFKVAHLALNILGQELSTLDPSLYNASRILRIPNTKHQTSGLYKVQLSEEELKTLSIEDIKDIAQEPGELMSADEAIEIPEEMINIEEPTTEKTKYNADDAINFSKKPALWKNCKWSLAQGNFKNGERHSALMVLASTCRGLGFTKEMTYDLCKGALRRSVETYGKGTTDKSELFKNIIEDSIFTDNWEGGQYTCKKPGFLQTYCNSLGEHKCNDRDEVEDKPFVKFDEMFNDLVKFSQDFEKNILKTGIKKLDDNCILSVSTLNGLLGQPGAGKTTMAMDYLKYTSKNDIPSAFFSLDMGKPIVTAKIIQQRIGMNFLDSLQYVKDQTEAASILAKTIIREDYANVNFNFKSGLTVSDMKNMVTQQEQISGRKIKLVVIDYLECLSGPYSDSNANAGLLSKQLKDMANEIEVCVLLLLQTQKHATADISDPLLTMRNIKGASAIEQDCTTILTLWRDGYSPKYKDDDKYISFAVVKTRFGGQWMGDFSWNPIDGKICELTEEQERELYNFKKRKKEDKIAQLAASSKGWE